MTTTPHEDAPLDPARMLALAEEQQLDIQRRKAAPVPLMLAAWAVAVSGSFLAFWLAGGGLDGLAVPEPVALVVFAVLWIAAMAISIVASLRIGRGIRPTAGGSWTATIYGLSWPLMILAVIVLQLGLAANGLGDAGGILVPVGISAGIGLLYLLGGGIWRSGIMVGVGLAILAGSLVAPFFGAPHHFLVLALVGGLSFGAGAVLTRRFAQPVGMWA